MKSRTLCCYAVPIKLSKTKPYHYECAACGLTTTHIGNKKLYLHVQRNIQKFMKNAPQDPAKLLEYLSTISLSTK